MTSILRAALILLTVATTATAIAQAPNATVDIAVVDNGNNELDVYVRPDADFDGVYSNLLFTIRWEVASGVTLGNLSQTLPHVFYMPIVKADDEADAGVYRYQTFAGFGFTPISATAQVTWLAGVEYKMVTIPYIGGTSTFEIIVDTWTNANNGDYYTSLNGYDRTGIIYSISTDVATPASAVTNVTVLPNPSQGQVGIQVDLTASNDLSIELMNSVGQVIWNEIVPKATGQYIGRVDLSGYSAGNYMFRVQVGEKTSTHPLVLE